MARGAGRGWHVTAYEARVGDPEAVPEMSERVVRLRAEAGRAGLDAVAVVPGPNMRYLTGLSFHLSERPTVALFPAAGEVALIVPALEAGKAGGAPFPARIFPYDDASGPFDAFAAAFEATGLAGRRIGVEARRIRFLELALFERAGGAPEAVDADPVFAALRMRKDDREVAHMRVAVSIAERALEATLPMVRPGATERHVAARLTIALLEAGSDPELPFSPIVAAGASGANPHAFPTSRILESGDLVTIDWGAAYAGYLSDITRTFALAGAPVAPELERAYDAVLRANEAGRAAARPGATGEAVDRAARSVIEAAGLGAYFLHRTGHGLGLEGHEEPDMKAGDRTVLEPGMTFTVEPGVYLPGVGGVRIEDDVLVTPSGAETLTTLDRALRVLG